MSGTDGTSCGTIEPGPRKDFMPTGINEKYRWNEACEVVLSNCPRRSRDLLMERLPDNHCPRKNLNSWA